MITTYAETIKKYPIGVPYAPWNVPESQLSGELSRATVIDLNDTRITARKVNVEIIGDGSDKYDWVIDDALDDIPDGDFDVFYMLNWAEYKLFGRTVREYYSTAILHNNGCPMNGTDVSGDKHDHTIVFMD